MKRLLDPLGKASFVDNIPDKPDGVCAHKDCHEQFDMREHDKPPSGWANVSFNRWGKKGSRNRSVVLCPMHTMEFGVRQPSLFRLVTKEFQGAVVPVQHENVVSVPGLLDYLHQVYVLTRAVGSHTPVVKIEVHLINGVESK
jgi:hypothetical protein